MWSLISIVHERTHEEGGCLDQRRPSNQVSRSGSNCGHRSAMDLLDDLRNRKVYARCVAIQASGAHWLRVQPNKILFRREGEAR